MMIVDKILDWARGRGYTVVYGSAGQVNEMLTDVDFASSNDATAVVMHLVTDSATVDGKDTAVVAVYFASLCDLDFDGESLLPEQERLKGIGKELLNDIRTGNEMTYADPRWQYGYDDYAENVCWVCLRVTLTASAADCVPLSPEPPAPPPGPEYDIFCPQFLCNFSEESYRGQPSPCTRDYLRNYAYVTIAVDNYASNSDYCFFVKNLQPVFKNKLMVIRNYGDNTIQMLKSALHPYIPMTEETEEWLNERKGRTLVTYLLNTQTAQSEPLFVLAADSATHFESKPVTVI